METIQAKTLFIALLLSTAAPLLLAEAEQAQMDLFEAVKGGDVVGVKQALMLGAEVDGTDRYGQTALMFAARGWTIWYAVIKGMDPVGGEHLKIAELLLENGADVNERDNEGYTALMVAVDADNLKMVEFLLEKDAAVGERDWFGYTALMLAAKEGHLKIAELLLASDADVNIKNNSGETALVLAVSWENSGIAKLLLKRGADVDKQDKNGWTALMHAAVWGNLGIAKLLLKKGADIGIESKKEKIGGTRIKPWEVKSGKTALEIAEQQGNTEIVKLIKDFIIKRQREKLQR